MLQECDVCRYSTKQMIQKLSLHNDLQFSKVE
jgi:hypothetical protein